MVYDFLSWKLNESLSSARERFLKPGIIDQETFDQLKALDPTPTLKYLEKIIGFYLNDKASLEELEQVVSRFHTLLGKNQVKTRDIGSFKNFDQLKQETHSSQSEYAQKQDIKLKSKDAEVVYEDDRYLVIIPRTHSASCKYGAGTKWCTTEQNPQKYKEYVRKEVTLYYIIDRFLDTHLGRKKAEDKNKNYKLSVAVYPNGKKECFNALDNHVTFEWIIEKTGLDPNLFTSNPTILTPYEKLDLDEDKIKYNEDGTIDYYGGIYMYDMKFTKIPLNFNFVAGDFDCSNNQLISLEGAPQRIDGSFYCSGNELVSLEGAPQRIGGSFYCFSNELVSLEGAPQEINGDFDCKDNKLISLEGGPIKVEGGFYCDDNQLINLKGSPREVGKSFMCNGNTLITLEGSPKKVGGVFFCNNNNLISIKDAPVKIGGIFRCMNNKPSLSQSEKQWALKNINAKGHEF